MIVKPVGRMLGILAMALGCSVVAACGSSSKTAAPAPTTAAPTTAAPTTAAAGGGGAPASASAAKVTIEGFAFHPQSDTVKVGTTVTWTNVDVAPHNVKWANDAFPISKTMHSGGSSANYSQTFTTAGTYNYICGIHTYMSGQVIVTP